MHSVLDAKPLKNNYLMPRLTRYGYVKDFLTLEELSYFSDLIIHPGQRNQFIPVVLHNESKLDCRSKKKEKRENT